MTGNRGPGGATAVVSVRLMVAGFGGVLCIAPAMAAMWDGARGSAIQDLSSDSSAT